MRTVMLFISTFYIISNFVFLNLFIALLLENFEYNWSSDFVIDEADVICAGSDPSSAACRAFAVHLEPSVQGSHEGICAPIIQHSTRRAALEYTSQEPEEPAREALYY